MEKLLPLDPNNIKKEEAFRLRDKHLPASLFKYFTVDDKKIKTIKENKLWLSCPTKFNDPYDCHFYIDLKKNTMPYPIFFDSQDEDINLSEDDLNKKYTKEIVMNYKQKLKVSCLTEDITSFLMWAHYAKSHTGFAIEYATDELKDDEEIYNSLLPVKYSDHLVDFSSYYYNKTAQGKGSSYFWRMAITKPKEFMYEKEWRLITHCCAGHDGVFYEGMPTPKSITIGANFDVYDNLSKELLNYFKELGVTIYQIDVATDNYRLEKVLFRN